MDRGMHPARTGRLCLWAGMVCVWVAFGASAWPLLFLPPDPDTMASLWMAEHLPWWAPFVDSLAASYDKRWYFNPLLTLSHHVDIALPAQVGAARHHLVGLLGVLLLSTTLARAVFVQSSSGLVGSVAAALFVFSSPTWQATAIPVLRHYVWASYLGLLSLLPAWHLYLSGDRPSRGGTWRSAIAFGLGLLFKEAIAGLPVLLFALAYGRSRTVRRAATFILPHTLVLGCYLVWRFMMLGGLGGYFHMPRGTLNPTILPLTLFRLVWGSAWVGVWVGALSLWLAPRLAWVWLAGMSGTLLPFVFATPATTSDLEFAGKLLLPFALYLLLVSHSLKRLGPWLPRVLPLVAALLLPLQWQQREATLRPLFLWVDTSRAQALPPPWHGPLVLVSGYYWFYTFMHQRLAGPQAPLFGFMTTEDAAVFRALGGDWPQGAETIGIPGHLPAFRRQELILDESEAHIDGRGFFRLRVPESEIGKLRLGIAYKNGETHWFASLPVQRRRVVLPLTYSDRAVVLYKVTRKGDLLARVWSSPFFTDPYPAGEGAKR